MLNLLRQPESALTGALVEQALDGDMATAMYGLLELALGNLAQKLSVEACESPPQSRRERELLSQQRVALRWRRELGILAKQDSLKKLDRRRAG